MGMTIRNIYLILGTDLMKITHLKSLRCNGPNFCGAGGHHNEVRFFIGVEGTPMERLSGPLLNGNSLT